jgi:hypothetical protein
VARRGIERRGGRRRVCGGRLPAEVGGVERGRVFCGRVHGSKGEEEAGDVQRPLSHGGGPLSEERGWARSLFIRWRQRVL